MILADRLGIVWFCIVVGVVTWMSLWSPLAPHAFLHALAVFGGVPWLLFRAVDFIVTGRIRVNV